MPTKHVRTVLKPQIAERQTYLARRRGGTVTQEQDNMATRFEAEGKPKPDWKKTPGRLVSLTGLGKKKK